MQVAPASARCSRSAGVRAYPMGWAPRPWAASTPAGEAVMSAHSAGVALSAVNGIFDQVGQRLEMAGRVATQGDHAGGLVTKPVHVLQDEAVVARLQAHDPDPDGARGRPYLHRQQVGRALRRRIYAAHLCPRE